VSKQAASGKLKGRAYRTRYLFFLTPAAGKFPQPIRALKPRHVIIADDGRVRLEMFSGWWPFGVYAYPEGYKRRFPRQKYGDRQLIDGLWYYDDGYNFRPEEYDKIIETMVRECGELRSEEEHPTMTEPNAPG
jgi:hypothetical protein